MSGPCDVTVSEYPDDAKFFFGLTGAQATARLKKYAGKKLRLRVRPWEASSADHEALHTYQQELIKIGKGLSPL